MEKLFRMVEEDEVIEISFDGKTISNVKVIAVAREDTDIPMIWAQEETEDGIIDLLLPTEIKELDDEE